MGYNSNDDQGNNKITKKRNRDAKDELTETPVARLCLRAITDADRPTFGKWEMNVFFAVANIKKTKPHDPNTVGDKRILGKLMTDDFFRSARPQDDESDRA